MLPTGFVAERQQQHQAAAAPATAVGEAGSHSLSTAPPIQPLDVSGGLAALVLLETCRPSTFALMHAPQICASKNPAIWADLLVLRV